ncbi:SDR family oxidoreductase [Candidatus Saccharibacteria bacterium]|nr:SDR family oxidoreductase [Candidatus Saccharibacteria bacterium]
MTAQQVIVITGGTGGMGLATATQLAAEKYRVLLTDIDTQRIDDTVKQLRQQGFTVEGIACDVTDKQAVAQLATYATSLGRVKSVVHAAGVSPQMGDASFIIGVNAIGTINIAEEFLRVATPGFSLINVASIAGHMVPRAMQPTRLFKRALQDPQIFHKKLVARTRFMPRAMRAGQAYSLSKSFVIWYSAKIAAQYGAKGARVVSVSPGTFDTAMGRLEEKSGSAQLIEHAVLHRYGKPGEVAELLAFLAQGKAFYVTGTDILIDGGTKAGLSLSALWQMTKSSLRHG